MMTKELFIESLNAIKKYDDYMFELFKLGVYIDEPHEFTNLIRNFTDVIKHCCKDDPEDEYEPSNIEYFMYEYDWGDYADKHWIVNKDGIKIEIKTVEDLWDYLVKLHPDIEDNDSYGE